MALTWFQRLSYRILGRSARHTKGIDKVARDLRLARIPMRAEAYIATTRAKTFLAGGLGIFVGAAVVATIAAIRPIPLFVWGAVPIAALWGALMTHLLVSSAPKSLAKKRAKNMDQRLPYAVNFMATMTSAGVVPQEVFRALARQPIYGEVASEAAALYEDMALHGKDLLAALHRAVERSPSTRWRDLLQGAITTVTSGGDLTRYLRQKADRFQFDHRIDQRGLIETMGLMAEAYVTVAVAGPLFLLVIMVIIVLVGSGGMGQLGAIVYLLLPVLNIGFAFGLKSMIPEA